MNTSRTLFLTSMSSAFKGESHELANAKISSRSSPRLYTTQSVKNTILCMESAYITGEWSGRCAGRYLQPLSSSSWRSPGRSQASAVPAAKQTDRFPLGREEVERNGSHNRYSVVKADRQSKQSSFQATAVVLPHAEGPRSLLNCKGIASWTEIRRKRARPSTPAGGKTLVLRLWSERADAEGIPEARQSSAQTQDANRPS